MITGRIRIWFECRCKVCLQTFSSPYKDSYCCGKKRCRQILHDAGFDSYTDIPNVCGINYQDFTYHGRIQ